MHYTNKQLSEITGYSRQYLCQLRKGVRGRPPKLIENIDYFWDSGRIYYTQYGYSKLKNFAKTKIKC